jgi:hypothetical protein
MFPDVRITVFDAFAQTVLCLDATSAGDIGSSSQIKYEDTPAGNAAATIPLALTLTEITARGYWRGMNIVEISAVDNVMTASCSSDATKIYIDSTSRFDPATGEDQQQAYFWDGATLCMRVPVTGIGHDGGGPFITIGTPLTGGGNPAVLPAYGAGTYVGARRYCGRIMRRSRPNTKNPQAVVTCVGLGLTGGMFDKSYATFAATNQDVGPLLYNSFEQFATRQGWQAVSLNSANFATIGTSVSMTLNTSPLSQWINQIITAIPTGDTWTVRMGHDRTPRLIKLYDSSSNTYTYPVTLPQNVTDFEPVNVEIDDEDVSNLYNSIEVIGDTDPTTNQPVADIGQDGTSISLYGQVDGAPQTVTGLKTVTDCQNYAVSLLNESSGPASNNKFRVFTTVAGPTASNTPAGLSNGDVVRGVNKVIITGFNDTGTVVNMVPDSNLNYTSGPDALWTLAGTTFSVTAGSGFNRFEIDGGGGGKSNIIATALSDQIAVAAGRIYSLSGFIDATGFTTTGVSGAQISWNVLDASSLAVIAHVSQTPGVSSTLTSTSFAIPHGTTRVVLEAILVGNVTAGQSILLARPMLVVGSTLPSSYVANAAVPHVFGLVASVVTTIDLHGVQYQDVQFAAVEPDWNAEMAERSQGLANALRQNTLPPVSIAQYCVSIEAFPLSGGRLAIPTTGLTVHPPTFLALFASGTNIQTVSGASFVLQPKCTNWAWLNSGLTWTVKQDPSPVAGSILYAIFQTSASAVIGQTQKAPVGVMKIGLGNVNVASNLPQPAVSNNGALTNVGSNHPTQADISASVNLTNVPQDGSAHSLYWAYREHGTTQWIAYAEDDLSGIPNPPASQTRGYVYAQMANGKLFDFAVGYVGFAGYGPPQQIGTTAQQSNGFAAKTLLVTLKYHDTGSIVNPTVTRSQIPCGSVATTLTSTVLAGGTNFPVASTAALSVGDNILIDDEPLVILHVHAGASIDTTTPSVNDHQNGANVVEAEVVTSVVSPGDLSIKISDNSVFSSVSIGQSINIDGNDSLTVTGTSAGNHITVAAPGAANSHSTGAIVYWEYAQNGISANGASSEVTLSFDLTDQPTDDTFAFVHVWYRVHGGTGKWTDAGAQPAVGTTTNPKTTPQRNSYVFGIADLTNGQNYDFACSMQSQAWHESTKHVIVSNFQANALNLGTGSLPKIPSGTTATATGSITGYTAVNGGAYHASYSATPVITPPGSDPRNFNQWGAGFAIYAKVRDQGPNTSTTLQAGYSSGSTGPFSVKDASHMSPGATVIMISGSNVDSLVINTVNTGANTFTTTVGTAYAHSNGDTVAFTDTDTTRHNYSLVDEIPNTTWTSGAITGITGGLSAGHAYQLAIMPIDEQNNPGPLAIFALTIAQYIGSGSMIDSPNLVPDPEFLHCTLNSSNKAQTDPYWTPYGNDGSTIYIGPGSFRGANCLQSIYHTDDGFGWQQMSEVIHLKAGTTYAFGAYIDAVTSVASSSGKTTANPSVMIVTHDGASAYDFKKNDPRDASFARQSALIRAEAGQALGVRGVVQGTYTPTSDEKVSLLFNSNGISVTGILVFGTPQLQVGSQLGPFKPGPKAKGTRPTLVPLNADQPLGPCDTQNGAALGTGGGYHDHTIASWQTQATIDSTTGADGSNLHANRVSVRHLKGDTTGGTDDLMSPTTKTLLRARHDASITTAIQGTADSDGSYITHGTVHAPHIVFGNSGNSVDLDTIPDGRATYQRVRGNQLIGGAMARGGVGKNLLVNPSFDLNDVGTAYGTFITGAGTPISNGWTVWDGNSFQIGAQLDNTGSLAKTGTNSLLIRAIGGQTIPASTTYESRVYSAKFPVKAGDVLYVSGNIRSDSTLGAMPSGTNMRQRIGLTLYDNAGHSQEVDLADTVLTSATGAYAAVANTYTVPATITGGYNTSFVQMELCGFYQNTSGAGVAIPSGNFDLHFDDINLSLQNVYLEHSPEIRAVIDSGSNILNTEFSGVKINANGTLTNWINVLNLAKEPLPTLVPGDTIEIDGLLEAGATGNDISIGIADVAAFTNGYRLLWAGSTNVQKIDMQHGGTYANVAIGSTVAQDTQYHGFKMTIIVNGASNNTLEGSIGSDGIASTTDTNLDLTSGGPYYVFVEFGASGSTAKVKHFQVKLAKNHRTRAHPDYQNTCQAGGGIDFSSGLHTHKDLDHIADATSGTYARIKATEVQGGAGGSGTVKQLNDGTNVRTAAIVATGLASAADTYGSAVQYGQVHRLHAAQTGQPGPANHLFNSTFSAGLSGWTGPVQNTGTGTWTWTTDSYGGGRLVASPSVTSAGSQFCQQIVSGLFNGNTYTISGTLLMVNTSGSSGAAVTLQVTGTPSNTVYASLSLSASAGPKDFAKAFTLGGSDTSVVVYVIVNNGSSGGSVTATFAKLQLEANSAPSNWVDHYAAKNVNHSHDTSANIIYTPFASPVALTSNGALTGFDAVNGTATRLDYPLPTYGCLVASCAIHSADSSEPISVVIGDFTNGYVLEWETSGLLKCVRYKGGVATAATASGFGGGTPAINTLVGSTVTRDSGLHLFRIAVDNSRFSTKLSIEAVFDGAYVMSPAIENTSTSGPSWLSGATIPITIRASNGNVLHFEAGPRQLYLAASVPYQVAVPP